MPYKKKRRSSFEPEKIHSKDKMETAVVLEFIKEEVIEDVKDRMEDDVKEAVEEVKKEAMEAADDIKDILADAVVDLQSKSVEQVAEEVKEKVLEELPAIVEVVKEQAEKVLVELKKELAVEVAESLDSCCGLKMPPALQTLLRSFLLSQSIPGATGSGRLPSGVPCDLNLEPLKLRLPPQTS